MNDNKVSPLKYFVLRTPIFPFNRLEELLRKDVLNDDILKKCFNEKIFREGVLYASPSFYNSLQKWLKGQSIPSKKKMMLRRKGLEYIIRMSSRCTTFGLFTGISTGIWGTENSITLNGNYHKDVRYDMAFCTKLASWIIEDVFLGNKLIYYPNSTIYEAFSEFRYIRQSSGKYVSKVKVNSIENNDFLKDVLDFCRYGRRMAELKEFMQEKSLEREFVNNYLFNLIDHKIIVSELEPNVSGPTYFEKIKQKVTLLSEEDSKQKSACITKLDQILNDLSSNSTKGKKIFIMDASQKVSKEFPEYATSKFFHIDLFNHAERCSLDSSLIHPLLNGLDCLIRLFPKRQSDYLMRFKEEFRSVFGNREIPLMKALDPESGIMADKDQNHQKYNTISDEFSEMLTKEPTHSVHLEETDLFLLKKIQTAYMEGKCTINIEKNEIPNTENSSTLPDTFNLVFSVLNSQDKLIHLKGLSGPSACHLLGRYARGNKDIDNLMQEITAHEKHNQDYIYAELIYCPEGPEANLCLRPKLREYEIPFLAASSVDEEYQIMLNDLSVSVVNGDIVLKSVKNNKLVKIFSSHSLDFEKIQLPVLRFLHELQSQSYYEGLRFDWGSLSVLFPFLPRVVSGNIVISPKSWMFKQEELSGFLKSHSKDALKKSIARWRYKHKIPCRILLEEYGQELYINLNSHTGIDLFLCLIKNKNNIFLKEFLVPDTQLVKGKNGMFTHEIIAPFIVRKKAVKKIQE